MRTDDEVETFHQHAMERYKDQLRAEYYVACYEGCLPRSLWEVTSADIKRNKRAFRKVVLVYIKRWRIALKYGYGLIFTGDNGTGKTLFMTFILSQLLKRNCSVYYTSLAQLDVDLKSCFGDHKRQRRLDHLLECDMLAIDELGKEHVKDNSYLRSRLELLLKTRCDNGDPTLLATNLDLATLEQHYGSSIASMLRGKFTFVPLICPDFREKAAEKMRKQMGFE